VTLQRRRAVLGLLAGPGLLSSACGSDTGIVTRNIQQAARVPDQTAFFNVPTANRPCCLVELDYTGKTFSIPWQKATEDNISGRFG
jgi:ABC-type phosphate transport system ATPase subunit